MASLTGLRPRLERLSPEQRHDQLVELVCSNAATVLGQAPRDVDADAAFGDLGFDSLTAVELRNRLKIATGLTLSPTLIFDQPTPAALAEHLDEQLGCADDRHRRHPRTNPIAWPVSTTSPANCKHWSTSPTGLPATKRS